jgi:hypothetical protein
MEFLRNSRGRAVGKIFSLIMGTYKLWLAGNGGGLRVESWTLRCRFGPIGGIGPMGRMGRRRLGIFRRRGASPPIGGFLTILLRSNKD